jgi:hypothetical protein
MTGTKTYSRRLRLLAASAATALVALVLVWGAMRTAAEPSAAAQVVVPTRPELWAGGGECSITVVLTASELFGYQFIVTFDPIVLEAVGAELDASFLNPEIVPAGWSGTIDNLAGTVRFAATQQKPTPAVSGSGPVARVRLKARSPASPPVQTEIGLSGIKLAEEDGTRIEPVTPSPGFLTIVPYSALEVRIPTPNEIMEAAGAITATLVLTCENTYGYQFTVEFDPALLEAQQAGFQDSFLTPDSSPPGWDSTIDNSAGTVRFAATEEKPAAPATGSGSIGWIRFVGKSPPTLPADAVLGIRDPRLASADGLRMTPEVISGSIHVLPKSVILGQVELQGREDWSGAVVSALPMGVSVAADASGFYTLTVPTAPCTVTVEMARYLDAERVLVLARGDNPLPRVRLWAGDANDDDEIDIVDMSIIGGAYDNAVDPLLERADINADGYVDIVDMVLAAGNYTLTSPVSWP